MLLRLSFRPQSEGTALETINELLQRLERQGDELVLHARGIQVGTHAQGFRELEERHFTLLNL